MNTLGYNLEFAPLPWKRCLKESGLGRIDGVVSASYNESRAQYLHFPADASKTFRSEHRIMQIEYAIATLTRIDYEYQGDPQTLPVPIQIPAGYPIGEELKKKGLNVDNASLDDRAISTIIRNLCSSHSCAYMY